MFGWLVGHLVIFFVLSKTRKEKRDDVKVRFSPLPPPAKSSPSSEPQIQAPSHLVSLPLQRLFPDVNAESREAVLAALGKLLKKYEDALPSEQQGYLCGTKGVRRRPGGAAAAGHRHSPALLTPSSLSEVAELTGHQLRRPD